MRITSASPRIICWGAATRGGKSVPCTRRGHRPRRPDGMAAPGACKGGYKPPVEIWAAVRRPRGFCSRRGLVQPGCTPRFLFRLAEKKTGRARPSGTLCSSAIPVAAVPWRMAPTSSGWLSHGAASLFATAHAPAKNPAARSAAERAEREADQMRPCTPLTFAPAPRESAFKPVPHPAAPVGRSSQTRRHHLSSTPVQQLCTDVQSCDQKRFFSYTGRGAFSFWR